MTFTEADFDRLSWHDCHIWGIELRAGDPDEEEWTSDLALDIDYIVQRVRGRGPDSRFLVAPADLVFHGITDPRIDVNWGDSGFRVALHPASVHVIERARVENQRVHLDRPYYSWRILLNQPDGGEITFGAVGFTQTLRADPVETGAAQRLTRLRRNRLTGRG